MKKILLMISALSLLFVSCSKEGPARFEGNWSYKTSGTVTLVPTSGSSSEQVTATIVNESGQMDIMTADSKSGQVLITMNALLGGATVMKGTAVDKRIDIEPFQKTVELVTANVDAAATSVSVSGYGERFDDTIIFYLEYEGDCTLEQTDYRIGGSDIVCIAKLNDF